MAAFPAAALLDDDELDAADCFPVAAEALFPAAAAAVGAAFDGREAIFLAPAFPAVDAAAALVEAPLAADVAEEAAALVAAATDEEAAVAPEAPALAAGFPSSVTVN